MFIIQNQQLKVTIAGKGAELQSIFSKQNGLEYLWQGDAAFWAKRSPVLFPIVGTLKEDRYYYSDVAYQLGRHGFARDLEFTLDSASADAVCLLLESNPRTLAVFPFEFELRVIYTVSDNNLVVGYSVKNNSKEKDLYFSIGGHPAFNVPLGKNLSYTDFYLEFNEEETTPRWPISQDGLIEKLPEPLLNRATVLPLSKNLFSKDALVLKNPASSVVSLKSDKTVHGLDFDFSGFPYLGLWAAKNADFVCIEPWCGIADSVDTDQQLIHKEGIIRLEPQGLFERSWRARFF